MRKVEHIEQQIGDLSREEFAELRVWVLERDWSSWDDRIAADSAGGKLNRLVEEAKTDFKAGRMHRL